MLVFITKRVGQGLMTVPSYVFDCSAQAPLTAAATVTPCHDLPQDGFGQAGVIDLDITGGIPPYRVEWSRNVLIAERNAALFSGAISWRVRIADQSGTILWLQGVTEACDGEAIPERTGLFLKWIGQDIKKESGPELEAAGLEWKDVTRHVTQAARGWYLEKTQEL